jgi:hypothetical protein
VALNSGAQYTFVAEVNLAYIQGSGTPVFITMAGPTVSSFNCVIKYEALFATTVEGALHNTAVQTTIGTNTGLSFQPSATGGSSYWVHLQGYLTTTSAANLTVNQATSGAVSTFTVQKGSGLWVHAV